MSGLLQRFFIWILSPFARLMRNVGDKTRNIVMTICFVLIFMLFLVTNIFTAYIRLLYECIFVCVLLGVIILFSLKGTLHKLKWSLWLTIPWFLTGLLILLSGIIVSEDYLPFAVFLLIIAPCFYFVWGNRESREPLFRSMTISMIFISAVIVLGCIILAPMQAGIRYYGIFTNPNGFAFICMAMTPFMLYGFLKLKGFLKWASLFMFGATVALIVFSISRTGLLAIGVALLVWVIAAMFGGIKTFFKKNIKNMVLIVASIAVTTALLYGALTTVNKYVGMDIVDAVNGIQGFFKVDAPVAYTKKPTNSAASSFSDVFSGVGDRVEYTDGSNMTTYSSGRVTIWVGYLKQLNLIGHPASFVFNIPGVGSNATAHCNFIQVAYDSGIPAGICYTVCCIMTGIVALVRTWKSRGRDKELVLVFAGIVNFGVGAVISTIYNPFSNMNALIYYLLLAAVFVPMAPAKAVPTHEKAEDEASDE